MSEVSTVVFLTHYLNLILDKAQPPLHQENCFGQGVQVLVDAPQLLQCLTVLLLSSLILLVIYVELS